MGNTMKVNNVIKIKHGASSPDGKLLPYELGVLDASEGKILYIGGENKDGVPGIAIPLMVRQALQANSSETAEVATWAGEAARADEADLAMVAETAIEAQTLEEGAVLPVKNGGTGASQFEEGVLFSNGDSLFTKPLATQIEENDDGLVSADLVYNYCTSEIGKITNPNGLTNIFHSVNLNTETNISGSTKKVSKIAIEFDTGNSEDTHKTPNDRNTTADGFQVQHYAKFDDYRIFLFYCAINTWVNGAPSFVFLPIPNGQIGSRYFVISNGVGAILFRAEFIDNKMVITYVSQLEDGVAGNSFGCYGIR